MHCFVRTAGSVGSGKPLTAKQQAAKDEKEKKKAEKDHLKAVTRACTLCAKAMPTLAANVNSATLALRNIDKEGHDHFGDEVVAELKEALAKLEEWKAEATELLHMADKDKLKAKPENVDFTKATLEGHVKALGETLGKYKEKMKIIRERKAQEKLANPMPKATRAKAKAKN